jgi:UDP-2-acetamido-3-amino-2,3-dideoxy-glucuronate N-acetyltransferase
MKPFLHPTSDIQSASIGSGTRIWQFCVILEGARIGSDCNICSHVFIENDVTIGDRVTIKCGVQIWDGIHLEDDVFIGPNVTFTNDPFPRSRKPLDQYPVTRVESGASIGANATILPGVTIGRGAMIGAGAIVTSDVPPFAILKGAGARNLTFRNPMNKDPDRTELAAFPRSGMNGADFIELKKASDHRGDLLAIEFGHHIPFEVQRVFFVTNVPTGNIRGEHAHKECHQLLVCLQGSVTITIDNGMDRAEWVLDRPEVGLHIHPMIWAAQTRHTGQTVLAVFASHPYDPDDYIRSYDDYLKAVSL